MTALLEVADLSKRFGGVRAVDGMNLTIPEGAIYGIIGPNGSGKTTFLSLLSGTLRPSGGTILFAGAAVEGIVAHRAVQRGIARTFQTTRLFMGWSLRQNLEIAAQVAQGRSGTDAAPDPLELTGLGERADVPCKTLSNAEQRLAMIATALATRPRMLLLDEPAVGMAPSEAGDLGRVIRRIRDSLGISIAIVEHNMHLMMGLADRIAAMNAGKLIAEGTPEEIRRHPEVISAYLGG